MKTFARKLKTGGGFTLAEVLVVVVILVMITAGLLPAAMNAYQKAVDAANAHTLLTEAVNALRGELSTAWDVKVSDGTTITYMSAGNGGQSKIYLDNNVIMIQDYGEYERTDAQSITLASKIFDSGAVATEVPDGRNLISEAMARRTGGSKNPMYVSYTDAVYDEVNGCITISGLEVKRDASSGPIAEMPENGLVISTLGGEQP